MKYLLLIILTFGAQIRVSAQSDSTISASSERMNIWYRNSYQPATQKQVMAGEIQTSLPKARLTEFKSDQNFLYTPASGYGNYHNMQYPYRPAYNNSTYFNSNNNGYVAASFGQILLASSINYVVDKAIAGKKKKKESKKD